jgi:hypothetical protein
VLKFARSLTPRQFRAYCADCGSATTTLLPLTAFIPHSPPNKAKIGKVVFTKLASIQRLGAFGRIFACF